MNAVSKETGVLGIQVTGSAKTGHHVAMEHEAALRDVFNCDDAKQVDALLSHCLRVLNAREADEASPANDERHFMLSIVNDIAPRDAIERMLSVQMATTHVALVRTARRFAYADQLPQYEAHERAYNKLARTFSAQAETLRKYRNGGKQTVTVQHVNVEDGGKAIVGHVEAASNRKRRE